MATDSNKTDTTALLEEIRALRREIVDDMRELGAKIDQISSGHNDLRVDYTRTAAQLDTRLQKVERDVSSLWEAHRSVVADVSHCKSEMDTHKAVDVSNSQIKKGVSEWIRWLPGLLMGLVALAVSLLRG